MGRVYLGTCLDLLNLGHEISIIYPHSFYPSSLLLLIIKAGPGRVSLDSVLGRRG